MRWDWRWEIVQWILLGGMLLLAVVTWASAPSQIPVHWNIAGEVDRYGGKVEGLLLIPLLGVALYLLMLFLPRWDPARASYDKFRGAYALIRLAVLLVLAGIYGLSHLWMRGYPVDMAQAVSALVGGLFVLLGSLMSRLRPNWFVGIRTPWTLSSNIVWDKTHQLGGWLFVAMGLAIIALGLMRPPWALGGLLVIVIVCPMIAVVYSYVLWRDAPDRQQAWP